MLESVYPTKTQDAGTVESFTYEAEKRVAPAVKTARPKALIPVFPGTNCEYDTHRALLEAGADAEQFIIRNLTSADVADSVERFAKAVKDSQIIVIPGGFSGGDEPDGSAKLITAFFRNAAVKGRCGPPRKARRSDARRVQRLPGAHQARSHSLARSCGHRR